jgi:hypothetical protein
METIGTHWKQKGCFVSRCFHFFFPQPARVREEACYPKSRTKRKKELARHHTPLMARAPACQREKRKNQC